MIEASFLLAINLCTLFYLALLLILIEAIFICLFKFFLLLGLTADKKEELAEEYEVIVLNASPEDS